MSSKTEWTTDEKRKFFFALQKYGAGNLELLQEALPDKTIFDIRAKMDFYSERGRKKFSSKTKKKNDPIEKWIKVLNQLQSSSDLHILPRVLKYIALFEKRDLNSDINIRDCYLLLSDMAKGVSPKEINKKSEYFLFNCCMHKIAEQFSKNQKTREFDHLNSLTDLELLKKKLTIKGYGRKKNDQTLFNPLQIPDHLLKVTPEDLNLTVHDL